MESALQIASRSQVIEWNTTKDLVEYPQDIKKVYFNETLKNRKNFTNWINKICKKFNKDIDWWVSLPASRNPYASNLYHFVCILKTLKYFFKKKKKISLLTDSKELKKIIDNKFKRFFEIKLIDEKVSNTKTIIKSIIFSIFLFLFIKLFIKKNFLPKEKLILIDTFAFQESIKQERLYKGLEKYIKLKNLKNLFFVPSFLIEGNIIKIIKIIFALGEKNYLFKEHYLKLPDLFYAIFYFIRVKKFLRKHHRFENFDLSSLINNEIQSGRDYSSQITALLNFRFSMRLYKNKIQIKKIVNWFENQIVDKGWNFGFRRYFPNCDVVGYQGFLFYGQYLNTFPSQEEFNSKVIPKKIYVISKSYIKLRKEFCKKLYIQTAPALYFQNFFKKFKKNQKIKVLLILSGIVSLDSKLLNWLAFLLKEKSNLKIVIKPHPILPLNKLNINILRKFKKNIFVSEKNLPDLLKSTKISISSGPTSGTIESIAYGCFVISPILEPYDAINLKILKIPKNSYKLVYDRNNFVNQVKQNLKKNIVIKRKKNFFLKISRENINIFF